MGQNSAHAAGNVGAGVGPGVGSGVGAGVGQLLAHTAQPDWALVELHASWIRHLPTLSLNDMNWHAASPRQAAWQSSSERFLRLEMMLPLHFKPGEVMPISHALAGVGTGVGRGVGAGVGIGVGFGVGTGVGTGVGAGHSNQLHLSCCDIHSLHTRSDLPLHSGWFLPLAERHWLTQGAGVGGGRVGWSRKEPTGPT